MVSPDSSLLRSANWTFASLCLGHKAADKNYAAVREVETEYNHPLVESSPGPANTLRRSSKRSCSPFHRAGPMAVALWVD